MGGTGGLQAQMQKLQCTKTHMHALPQSYSTPVKARKRGKGRNRGRRRHRRSPAATARRRMRGGERLGRALHGLQARRPVHRVLLASAVKIFVQVNIPEALAPAVLRDAACDIVRRLHGEPAQAFRPEGTPNAKPTGQHHMCSHKWRVVYKPGTVYLTISRHSLHEGRCLPYVFLQGSLRPVVGVAHLFDP